MMKKDVLQSKKELVLIKNFNETSSEEFSEKSLTNLEKDIVSSYEGMNSQDKKWVDEEYANWLGTYLEISNDNSCRCDCNCACS